MAYRPLMLITPWQRGGDVSALQTLIQRYDPAPGGSPFVDGIFGPNTKTALIAFQRDALESRNLGVATPDFQARYKLPQPTAAVQAPLAVEPVAPEGASLVAASGPSRVNWKLWLSLGGLVAVGFLATRKKSFF